MHAQNELATEITLVWKKKLAVQALWFYVPRRFTFYPGI